MDYYKSLDPDYVCGKLLHKGKVVEVEEVIDDEEDVGSDEERDEKLEDPANDGDADGVIGHVGGSRTGNVRQRNKQAHTELSRVEGSRTGNVQQRNKQARIEQPQAFEGIEAIVKEIVKREMEAVVKRELHTLGDCMMGRIGTLIFNHQQSPASQYVVLSNDETVPAENVANACSSQGDAVVAAAGSAGVAGKATKSAKSNDETVLVENVANACSSQGAAAVAGKATKNAKGDTVVATAGKDNQKSVSGVPSITEGDADTADNDYR
ncbi:hypothetical protein LWI29_037919 [Acer saccharum]|uniref:Uncharacterized protein n=1 Tax=Acer saccharum TaxID=4024 RepID=A0AA39SFQ9_ACESA|nr:hypothetical protein LWI29_037919 [Acer saccharum]